ncbi:hypothetical protein A9R01_05895 ['Osedax' symbiont bacterium Rs2_46_30_T18]|nr:hypothetical protein A9R01_05895 ['Osedax' symbiont bacterium Rs2_46_30_T18]
MKKQPLVYMHLALADYPEARSLLKKIFFVLFFYAVTALSHSALKVASIETNDNSINSFLEL